MGFLWENSREIKRKLRNKLNEETQISFSFFSRERENEFFLGVFFFFFFFPPYFYILFFIYRENNNI